jgi:ATP phosphoribosyltransferase regulatory subunit
MGVTEPVVPEAALAAIRAPLRAFAPDLIGVPVLLPLGRLLDLAGEAMRARLAVVETDGAEPMALRPDFTIAVAGQHLAGRHPQARYAYEGVAFTAGAPPAEFLQLGVEAYGAGEADEWAMMRAAWDASLAGGREDLSMVIGGVGMFRAFVEALGAAPATVTRLVRALPDARALTAELERAEAGPAPPSEAGGRLAAVLSGLPEGEATGVLEELWRLAGIQPVGGRGAAEIVHRLVERQAEGATPRLTPAQVALIRQYLAINGRPDAAVSSLKDVGGEIGLQWETLLDGWLDALQGSGLPMGRLTLDTAFARPFGYYDGMLFEVRSAALGPDKPVAAGGRYDSLLTRLGGAASSAVGCMVRPARAWNGAAQ